MLSAPISPRAIDGRYYVALDMGADPQMIPFDRRGLAALYKRDLNLDPRRIVGFARNISLFTEEQVMAMTAPSAVEHLPTDLFNPGLLFSGVYEDGWIAEAAKFRLGSSGQSRSVRITVHLPGVGALSAGAMIDVLVDGQQMERRRLVPGDVELVVPVTPATGPRWVEIRFDTTERLPQPDSRIVSVLLKSIALSEDE
jgi:hypothetical protein